MESAKHSHPDEHDVLLVGSGLSGGWAAKELTESGLKVLLLEAGPFLDVSDLAKGRSLSLRERSQSARHQPIQSKHPSYWHDNPNLFVDDQENPYSVLENPFLWIRGRQVGGRSLTWLGITLRMSDSEFLGPEREGFGQSWPLTYSELAPFYDKVESFLHVQGSMEGLPQLPDGRFLPPPSMTSDEREFRRVVESRWPVRRVIHCRGVPLCENGGGGYKWPPKSSLHNTLAAALTTGRLTLRPNSVVSHLVTDGDTGSVRAVGCVDRQTKRPFEVPAKVCVLCASAFESVRIMLNSKSRRHPHGVGNSSGLLGHFIFDHKSLSIGGTDVILSGVEEPQPLGGAHGILIPRFRNLSSCNSSYSGGFGIWGFMRRQLEPRPAEPPRWLLTALLEVLPNKRNRIEIDEHKTDAWGIPVARINLAYGDNEHAMTEEALACMQEMAGAAELTQEFESATLPGQYAHEIGGARMGTDRASSVLNRFNQCWDASNLFVLDGACFVSAGWQNPSLTMMALTARACSYIIGQCAAGNI